MAKIYNQYNDNNLILNPREAMYRQFNVGQWTELRIGMLFGITDYSSDSSGVLGQEDVYILTEIDRMYFGIKSSGSNMPGISGTNYIGATTGTGSGVISRVNPSEGGNVYGGYYRFYLGAASGSAPINIQVYNTNNTNGFTYNNPMGANSVGFYGLKFVLQNSGSANQCVIVNYRRTNGVQSGSATLHENILNDSSWNAMADNAAFSTASWVPGTPLPDTFFTYLPFYKNRLRITALEVVKVS